MPLPTDKASHPIRVMTKRTELLAQRVRRFAGVETFHGFACMFPGDWLVIDPDVDRCWCFTDEDFRKLFQPLDDDGRAIARLSIAELEAGRSWPRRHGLDEIVLCSDCRRRIETADQNVVVDFCPTCAKLVDRLRTAA